VPENWYAFVLDPELGADDAGSVAAVAWSGAGELGDVVVWPVFLSAAVGLDELLQPAMLAARAATVIPIEDVR